MHFPDTVEASPSNSTVVLATTLDSDLVAEGQAYGRTPQGCRRNSGETDTTPFCMQEDCNQVQGHSPAVILRCWEKESCRQVIILTCSAWPACEYRRTIGYTRMAHFP
jgi:hypothetical protein